MELQGAGYQRNSKESLIVSNLFLLEYLEAKKSQDFFNRNTFQSKKFSGAFVRTSNCGKQQLVNLLFIVFGLEPVVQEVLVAYALCSACCYLCFSVWLFLCVLFQAFGLA